VIEVGARVTAVVIELSTEKISTATHLPKAHREVEVPGMSNSKGDPSHELLAFPETGQLPDYTTTPCIHECEIVKQMRYVYRLTWF
jgi:hypothetical protein